jgi:hypothetical protein
MTKFDLFIKNISKEHLNNELLLLIVFDAIYLRVSYNQYLKKKY